MDIKGCKVGQTVWDTKVNGLHMRHLPSGRKVFFLYYRTRAKVQRRPKLGDYPQLQLPDARRIAKDLLTQVARGEDPKEKWDASREELTVSELFTKVWLEHWNTERYQDSGWARQVEYNYRNHIAPAFAVRKLSDITPPDIRNWHKKFLTEAPYAGNRSLEILSRMFSFAEEQGFRPLGSNPCSVVASHTEKKRDRYATRQEIVTLGTILERERNLNPREAVFIFTLMFSGARPRSIERALKSDLSRIEDSEGVVWGKLTFSGKTTDRTGEDESVLIPPHVLKLIDDLPPLPHSPNRNPDRLFGIRMPTAFWNRVKEEAGCDDLWVRDWRRTFASIALSEGVSSGVVGEILNHKSAQTTKVYAKLMNEARVEAVQTVSERYKKLIGGWKK